MMLELEDLTYEERLLILKRKGVVRNLKEHEKIFQKEIFVLTMGKKRLKNIPFITRPCTEDSKRNRGRGWRYNLVREVS